MRLRVTWIIVGAVVIVGVVGGLDALRSSGEPPTASAEPNRTITTTGTGRPVQSSSVLETFGPPVKLIRGRITADVASDISATFTVPSGWYGYQSDGEFEIAKSLPSPDAAKTFQFGGIAVHTVDDRLADALRELETSDSYRVIDDATVHIGGYSGRSYIFKPREAVALGELLGVPGVFEADEQLILLGVGHRTLLIRPGFDTAEEEAEVNRVLESFEFHP